MSTHRSPRGGEVAELARLLPVPAERDLPDERMLLLREHLMGELHAGQGPGWPAGRRTRAAWPGRDGRASRAGGADPAGGAGRAGGAERAGRGGGASRGGGSAWPAGSPRPGPPRWPPRWPWAGYRR